MNKEETTSHTVTARNPQSATRVWSPVAGHWLLVVAWMAVIFYLSAQSGLGGMELPAIFQTLRKGGHIFEYAVLGLLLGRALIATWQAKGETLSQSLYMRAWLVGVAIATAYAITDEIHQSFVPQRGGHVLDVMLDALSAAAALGFWYRAHLKQFAPNSPNRETM